MRNLRFAATLTVLALLLLGCQTTQVSLIYPSTYLLAEKSTASALLYWHFGGADEAFWDRFNASYESTHLNDSSGETTGTKSDSAQGATAADTSSREPPPGYRDLRNDPTMSAQFAWFSSEHSFSIDERSLPKMREILDLLKVEIQILDNNIVNLNRTDLAGQFIASKPIVRAARLVRIAHTFGPPSVDSMVETLRQSVRDYNSIVDALRSAGFFYLGLESISAREYSIQRQHN